VNSKELVKWRERNDCSQGILSIVLGVDVVTISRWERDVQKIPTFLQLALKYIEQNRNLITDVVERRKEQRRILRERRLAERRMLEKAAKEKAAKEKRDSKRRKSLRRVSKRRATD
jgi:transcriptional regulator with XRE-family HTH domain